MANDQEHSLVGASSCERFWNCPGSVGLQRANPKAKTTSIHAATGTVGHSLAEEALSKGKFISHFIPRIGEVVVQDGYQVEITEDMLEKVMFYINTVRSDLAKSNHGKLIVEHNFKLDWIHPEARGTSDAMILEEFGKLTAYDLKMGHNPVNAYRNKQLLYYSLGGYKLGDFLEIDLVIVQPNRENLEDRIQRWTISAAELETFEMELQFHIEQTDKPNAEIKSGPWCDWCPNTLTCPKMREAMVEIGLSSFDEFKKPTTPESGYTTKQLSAIMKALPLAKSWIKEIENLAFDEAQRGTEIKGFKLVKSWGNRTWLPGAEEEINKLVSEDISYKKELKTVAQLEKSLSKEFVALWSHRPDRGTKLVEDGEKGEAIKGGKTAEAIEAAFND